MKKLHLILILNVSLLFSAMAFFGDVIVWSFANLSSSLVATILSIAMSVISYYSCKKAISWVKEIF
jgi:hypothetical protein